MKQMVEYFYRVMRANVYLDLESDVLYCDVSPSRFPRHPSYPLQAPSNVTRMKTTTIRLYSDIAMYEHGVPWQRPRSIPFSLPFLRVRVVGHFLDRSILRTSIAGTAQKILGLRNAVSAGD